MTIKQVNVPINRKEDLDFGETLKSLTPSQAFEELYKWGTTIFAKFEVRETGHTRGCKKCNVAKKTGNFCSTCGSKISDKLEYTKVVRNIWLGISKDKFEDGDGLWISESHPYAGGGSYNKCRMGLARFMSIKYWYKY